MYQVIYQYQENIEIALSDQVSKDEFLQVLHQLESLIVTYNKINVLLDTSDLANLDFDIMKDEMSFFKNKENYLARIAVVTEKASETIILNIFDKLTNTDIRTYTPGDYDEAVKWIFPPKLP